MANNEVSVKVDASYILGLDLHDICVLAVEKMVAEGIDKHISYVSPEDNVSFGLKAGGRVPKVTIEWVDEAETISPTQY